MDVPPLNWEVGALPVRIDWDNLGYDAVTDTDFRNDLRKIIVPGLVVYGDVLLEDGVH